MFKHILVPTDGSARANRALRRGLALARRLGAKVSVIHIFSPFVMGFYGDINLGGETLERDLRRLAERQGRKYLDRADRIAKSAGVKVHRLLIEDVPVWKGIIDAARRKRCDAIFMGAHGRGSLSSLLLGSHTNSVLAHSKIPVLVYR